MYRYLNLTGNRISNLTNLICSRYWKIGNHMEAFPINRYFEFLGRQWSLKQGLIGCTLWYLSGILSFYFKFNI